MSAPNSENQVFLESALSRINDIRELSNKETPLNELDDVTDLQNDLQHHVADMASELMTGLHKRSQQYEYVNAYRVYRELLGTIAVDIANRTYETDNDTGSAKRAVQGYLQQSKRQMVALDYQKRLEKSRIERGKQWLAHHRKTRIAGAFAVSGTTTSVLVLASQESEPFLELSSGQSNGLTGLAVIAGMIALRSAIRSGSYKAGSALKNQLNSSVKAYTIENKGKQDPDVEKTLSQLPERYAEHHLSIPFGAAAMYLTNYDLTNTRNGNGPHEFEDMIKGTLDITESSMMDSYGINPDKLDSGPWYRRVNPLRYISGLPK